MHISENYAQVDLNTENCQSSCISMDNIKQILNLQIKIGRDDNYADDPY